MVLKYDTFGNSGNRKIVCIHGWGYTFDFFPKFLEEASKEYYVININLPGYKDEVSTFYTIPQLGSFVEETINSLNISDDDIIYAHSMGSLIMLTIIQAFKRNKIILTGCPLNLNPPFYAFLLKNKFLVNIISKSNFLCNKINNLTQNSINPNKKIYNGNANTKTVFFNTCAIIQFNALKYYEPLKIAKNVKLIYGEEDKYLGNAKKMDLEYIAIPKGKHNVLESNTTEFLELIR